MNDIDEVVLSAVEAQVFAPARMAELLLATNQRLADHHIVIEADLARARRRKNEAEAGLTRLYAAIEKGVGQLDEPVLKRRIQALRTQASDARTRIAALELRGGAAGLLVTPETALRASTAIRRRLRDGPPEVKKRWLRQFVREVTIYKQRIVIRGPVEASIDVRSDHGDRRD